MPLFQLNGASAQTPAGRQDAGSAAPRWELLVGMTSAQLAAAGWELVASSGLSWPDGRQGLVTFWRAVFDGRPFLFRCVTAFDAYMEEAGEACKQVVQK